MNKFKHLCILIVTIIAVLLTSCSKSELVIDYFDAESFEEALNNGENLEGKVVRFVAKDLKPDSAYGYDIWAGEHLNFVSSRNPDVKKGDIVTVRTTTIESVLGSWIINYEKLNVIDGSDSDDSTNGSQQEETNSNNENNSFLNNLGADSNDYTTTILPETEPEEETNTEELALEIVEHDFYGEKSLYDDMIDISYYALIHNPNELIVSNPMLNVTIIAEDGSILGTEQGSDTIIMPGDTIFISGNMSVPSADITDKTKIYFETDYSYLTGSTIFEEIKSTDLSVSNIKERNTQYESFITGIVTNNYAKDISLAELFFVLKKDGKTVYIGSTFVNNLKVGKETPFQYESYSVLPDHDTVEVYFQAI